MLQADLLMYLALAQTVIGFFGPYRYVLQGAESAYGEGYAALSALRTGMTVSGAVAWLLAIYVGPVVSLLRSPFGRRITITLALAYVVLLVLVSRVWSLAHHLERSRTSEATALSSWLGGLVAPLMW